MMLTSVAALTFPALMALAGSYDLLTMTIPNRISLALVGSFLILALFAGMPPAVFALHLLSGAVLLAIGFTCFALGWMGGGDAKLAAAAGLWLGWSHVLEFAVVFSLLGGALTLFIIIWRRIPMPAFAYRADFVARLHDHRTGIPYGIALAAAALVLFPETDWAGYLAGR